MNESSRRPISAVHSSASRATASNASSDQSDEVELVHAHDDVAQAEQRADRQVPAALAREPSAHVDEHDRRVGGRGAGEHVARVLRVARAVDQHEAPARRGERAVRDVDRDALLALGAQAVGELREVVRALVGQQRAGVVQQAPDQRRLAVVDGAGGRDPQEVHQKYPSRLRSSIAASLTRSSARVCPRSVTSVAAISATTSSSVAASERTAPVTTMSPTVR